MISPYKLKVILWYTGLLTVILIAVFITIYIILDHQLREEIDKNLLEKIKWINSVLRDTKDPPKPGYWSRRQNKWIEDYSEDSINDFLDYLVSRRPYDFYDIREHTDVVDDKYILFTFCGDSLIYLSEKYEKYKIAIEQFQVKKGTIPTIKLLDVPFSMAAIYKTGYSVYVGYELSTISSLQNRIMHIFLMVFPFGIILSILCGYFVTQRSLKVINTINRTAARITSKSLNERIKAPSGKDEISELIVTLNSMIDRLEKSFIMVQQFSQDAAHEIRTPLTIIRGGIEELLRDESCPEVISQTLENILEEMQYLSSISNKLLLIHSLDTDETKYHFTPLNLDSILEETCQDAQILSSQKQININLKKKESIQVMGNEELLIRLLWNVIDNAIKYNKPGGSVFITLEKVNNNAVILVKDTGIGIPSEEIPKIFDRFYRVDKSRSRELGGSGLGLAICKWIVDLHKGEILVESEVDKGSEFTIFLPITDKV